MASVITAGTTSTTALNLTGDTSGELQIKTNNGSTTAMTLTTGGNVGIGSTGPVSRLEVVNTGVATLYIGYNNTSENYYDANTQIFRNAAATERMRIDSSGNVGIGTSSPANRLSVSGATSYASIVNTTAGTDASPSFSGLRFYGFAENTDGLVASLDAGNSQGNNYGGRLRFSTQPEGGGGLVERMRIDMAGNVGIGTASPSNKLQVSGTAGTANAIASFDGSDFVRIYADATFGSAVNWSSGDALRFATSDSVFGSFTERMRLNSSGTLILQGGSTSATGVGITFPATQSASSNANTLDDYEEGTFTPTLGGSITNPTITYIPSFTYGKYTKIGNLVYITLEVRTSAYSGGSGYLKIEGLPFAKEAALNEPCLALSLYNITFDTAAVLDVEFDTTTSLYVRISNSGAASTQMQVGAWPNTNPTLIRISGCYQAAS